jgi:uncharacterized RDD family membrane protein YckC
VNFSSHDLVAGLLATFQQILFGLGEVMVTIAKSSGYNEQWTVLLCRGIGLVLTIVLFKILGNKIWTFLVANKKGVLIILVVLWLINSGRGGNALDALIQ